MNTWSKFHDVLKTQIITRLLNWCWQTQSLVFKTHVLLKQDYMTLIKWQLLSLNHTKKKNIVTSDLIGTWEHSQTMILEQILWYFPTLHLNSDYSSLDLCVDICIRALDIYALKKRKYFRVNNSPFINIAISKAKLDRTRLRKTFLKNKSAENWLIIARKLTVCH